jgi:hypothetical protein
MLTHVLILKVDNPDTVLASVLENYRKNTDPIGIPLRSDGSAFKIEDLSIDQKKILAEVLQAVSCSTLP